MDDPNSGRPDIPIVPVPEERVSRTQRSRSTREGLLRAAGELFARDGVSATRTVDIARMAGVAHGTVFLHFPTRGDLVAEVVSDFGGRVVRRMHERAKGAEGVREVLRAHLEGLAAAEDLYYRLVSEAPVLPPIARHTLFGIQSAMSLTLHEAARRETAEGAIEPMPMHLLFNTWIGLVHHYVVNRDLFAPGESVLARRGEEILKHYMGLLAPKR